jgi:hypothetical protein
VFPRLLDWKMELVSDLGKTKNTPERGSGVRSARQNGAIQPWRAFMRGFFLLIT